MLPFREPVTAYANSAPIGARHFAMRTVRLFTALPRVSPTGSQSRNPARRHFQRATVRSVKIAGMDRDQRRQLLTIGVPAVSLEA